MPIVNPGSPLLAGFDPNSPFIPMPERGSVWDRTEGFASQAGKALFALQDFKSFASAAQHVVANNAILDGVPSWALSGFTTLFDVIPKVNDGEQLAKGIVKGAAEIAQQSLASCSTSIPIIGLIVNMGLFMWEAISAAIKSARVERPPKQAIVYDFAADLLRGGDVIELARSDDWTQLFMPPNTDGGWTIESITWTPNGGKEGWQWRPAQPGSAGLGGLLPGIAEELGVYQVPRRAIGFSGANTNARPWDFYTGTGMGTVGTFTPCGRKFAALLWQSIMKPSVAMFAIDNDRIRRAWVEYFDSMWEFAETLDRQQQWSVKRACVYTKIDPTASGPKVTAQSRIAKFPTAKMVGRLGNMNHRYSDIVRYVCDVHRERARAACDSLVAAYVSPNAPLLASNGHMKVAHTRGRIALLSSAYLNSIELDLVPDEPYRAAVVQARIDQPQRTPTPPPGNAPQPFAIVGVATVPNPPPPDQGAPIDVNQDDGAGMAILAGGVALLAGAIAIGRMRR